MALTSGKTFATMHAAKTAIHMQFVEDGRRGKVLRAESFRYIMACTGKKCEYRITARWLQRSCSVSVSVSGRHTCSTVGVHTISGNYSKWVVDALKRTKVPNIESMSPKDVVEYIKKTFKVTITYFVARRALKKALGQGPKMVTKGLSKLESFCEQIRSVGGIAQLVTENGSFKRVFFSTAASRKAYPYLLPIVSIDGTHLLSAHKGVLLLALAPDCENQLVLIAAGIVEGENHDSWSWFLELLKQSVPSLAALPSLSCIMSDRDKGIISAVQSVFPDVPHAKCLRHLSLNFKSKFKNSGLCNLLWSAGTTFSRDRFAEVMDTIKKTNLSAYEYLKESDPKTWANSQFSVPRYTRVTSNNVETYNSVFKPIRGLPYLDLLLKIHRHTMDIFAGRHGGKKFAKEALWSSWASQEIQKRSKNKECYQVIKSSDEKGLVILGNKEYVVDLSNKTCSCIQFQSTRIPCVHALAMASAANVDPYVLLGEEFSRQNYVATYSTGVEPISRYDLIPSVAGLNPPQVKQQRGRPKKKRAHHPAEAPKKKRCAKGWKETPLPVKQ
jgi:hypothetical protein